MTPREQEVADEITNAFLFRRRQIEPNAGAIGTGLQVLIELFAEKLVEHEDLLYALAANLQEFKEWGT